MIRVVRVKTRGQAVDIKQAGRIRVVVPRSTVARIRRKQRARQ